MSRHTSYNASGLGLFAHLTSSTSISHAWKWAQGRRGHYLWIDEMETISTPSPSRWQETWIHPLGMHTCRIHIKSTDAQMGAGDIHKSFVSMTIGLSVISLKLSLMRSNTFIGMFVWSLAMSGLIFLGSDIFIDICMYNYKMTESFCKRTMLWLICRPDSIDRVVRKADRSIETFIKKFLMGRRH